MIRQADETMRSGIRDNWKKCFTLDDPRYTDYFFKACGLVGTAIADIKRQSLFMFKVLTHFELPVKFFTGVCNRTAEPQVFFVFICKILRYL